MNLPVLDSRKSSDFYQKAIDMALEIITESGLSNKFKTWVQILNDAKKSPTIADEPSLVLYQIFAKLAEFLASQNNELPYSYQTAFFDLIGISLRPPQSAHVPITFKVVESEDDISVFIPSHTKLGCSKLPDVYFETEEHFTAHNVQFSSLYFFDSLQDKFSNYSHIPNLQEVTFFESKERCPHGIWLDLGSFADLGPMKFGLSLKGIDKEYFSIHHNGDYIVEGDKNWPTAIRSSLKKLSQKEDRFGLYLQPSEEVYKKGQIKKEQKFSKDSFQLTIEKILPDAVIYNDSNVEMAKGFPLFTEDSSKFPNTLYIASMYFNRTNADYSINFETNGLQLHLLPWEYWDGEGWRGITKKEDFSFQFETEYPPQPLEINGLTSFWLRLKFDVGYQSGIFPIAIIENFVQQQSGEKLKSLLAMWKNVTPTDDFKRNQELLLNNLKLLGLTKDTIPFISSIYISYKTTLQSVTRYHNFQMESNLLKDGDLLYKFSDLKVLSFFLGTKMPLGGKTINLYFDTSKDSKFVETVDQPILTWKYFSKVNHNWNTITNVQKRDSNFFRSGDLVVVSIPSDIESHAEFGETLFWLRIDFEGGNVKILKENFRLQGIYPNTIWASNQSSTSEIIGSTNKDINQQYILSNKSILEKPIIEIQENKMPSFEEIKVIGEEHIRKNTLENLSEEIWITWKEVPNFSQSSPKDRHYVMDHQKGIISFGDGRYGMIPSSSNNILATYNYGGGSRGNVLAYQVDSLTCAIANIDSVINHTNSFGGNDQDTLELAKENAPNIIKTQNYAVTLSDFQWLAKQASQDVLATYCYMTKKKDADAISEINIAVLPKSKYLYPKVQADLEDTILEYLKTRCYLMVKDRIKIQSPDYVSFNVEIILKLQSPKNGSSQQTQKIKILTEQKIQNELTQFFDPTKGGETGLGWKFQATISNNQVKSLLSRIPNIDYIEQIKFILLPKENSLESIFLKRNELPKFVKVFLKVK